MLRTLDNDSIHRICSGQVVIDLASAIKELIENAIDSGATLIEIKLKDMGLESIEVSDNGCGIEPNDYNTLATKHCTSKLDKFSDLDQLKSFGFRGEALNALCELSSHFTVLTKQKSQSLGYQLFFNSDGRSVTTVMCLLTLV
jgi:DNA mismatch repair protein PMS2